MNYITYIQLNSRTFARLANGRTRLFFKNVLDIPERVNERRLS